MSLTRLLPRPAQLLWGLLGTFVVVAALVGFAYARTPIPSPSIIAAAQTTTLYYSDGKTVLATLGATNRTDVPLSQVPVDVQHAVLAAEDRQFYREPGISPTGIVRALLVDLKGGDVTQGGSTITQQYAKNAYLSSQRSFTRKLKEIIIATKLGQSRSKDSILEDYLNTIYFGRNSYGIAAAAKAYFGQHTSVSSLTTAQGALLAAIIRGPGLYDPRVNPAAALQRWHYVVDGMVGQGWLSQAKADTLRFPHTVKATSGSGTCGDGPTRYICNAVASELLHKDGLTQAQYDLGGLKVVTTIDKPAQDAAVSAESSLAPKSGHAESALVSVKPGDGAIEAMYAGRKFCAHRTSDDCTDLTGVSSPYTRQPGSSMKPYTLVTALKQGVSLNQTYTTTATATVNGTTITNSGGEVCGSPCTLTRALAESINTVFVPLAQQVGPHNIAKVAYDSGVTTHDLSISPEITLGTENVSVLDQANGYATIAAKGMRATPYLVSSVKNSDGQTLYTAHPTTTRAYSAAVAANAAYAMTKVLDCSYGGTACGKALAGGRPSAGKTGTTTSNTNAWFIGFTPQLSTAVWLGNDTKHAKQPVTSGGLEVYGGDVPARIWQSMMNAALSGKPVVAFPTPTQTGTITPVSPTSAPTSSATGSPSASPSPTKSSASPTSTPTPTHTASHGPTPSHSPTPTHSATGKPTKAPDGSRRHRR